jgi:hypothetical protein
MTAPILHLGIAMTRVIQAVIAGITDVLRVPGRRMLPNLLCVRIAADIPDFVNLAHKIRCCWQVVEVMI